MYRFTLLLGDNVLQEYAFEKAHVSIGRHEAADIVIPNRAVSRHHAVIRAEHGQCTVTDVGAKNGIRVNGVHVKTHPLQPGDEIKLGKHILRFDGSDNVRSPGAGDSGDAGDTGHYQLDLKQFLANDSGPSAPPRGPAAAAEFHEQTVTVYTPYSAARPTPGANDGPAFHVLVDGRTTSVVRFASDQLVIGKSEAADIKLTGFFAPAVHSHIIRKRDGNVFIRSHRLRPKLMINGRAKAQAYLKHGDQVTIGSLRLLFHAKSV